MLGVQVVGHAVIWSLAGRVAQCCGSYAQFFFLKNPSRFYNYLFALNEKNVSSFSSVISGCWYDWWSSYSMSLCPPPDIIVWPDRNNMLYLSTEITEKNPVFVYFFYFFIQYLIQLFDTDNGGTFVHCVSFASCLAFCGLGIQVVDQFWSLAGWVAQCCGKLCSIFFIKTKQKQLIPLQYCGQV